MPSLVPVELVKIVHPKIPPTIEIPSQPSHESYTMHGYIYKILDNAQTLRTPSELTEVVANHNHTHPGLITIWTGDGVQLPLPLVVLYEGNAFYSKQGMEERSNQMFFSNNQVIYDALEPSTRNHTAVLLGSPWHMYLDFLQADEIFLSRPGIWRREGKSFSMGYDLICMVSGHKPLALQDKLEDKTVTMVYGLRR